MLDTQMLIKNENKLTNEWCPHDAIHTMSCLEGHTDLSFCERMQVARQTVLDNLSHRHSLPLNHIIHMRLSHHLDINPNHLTPIYITHKTKPNALIAPHFPLLHINIAHRKIMVLNRTHLEPTLASNSTVIRDCSPSHCLPSPGGTSFLPTSRCPPPNPSPRHTTNLNPQSHPPSTNPPPNRLKAISKTYLLPRKFVPHPECELPGFESQWHQKR